MVFWMEASNTQKYTVNSTIQWRCNVDCDCIGVFSAWMTLGIERSLHSTIHVIEAPTLFKHYPFLMVDYSHIGPPIRNCVVWGRWMTARGYGVKAHGWQLWQIHMHTHQLDFGKCLGRTFGLEMRICSYSRKWWWWHEKGILPHTDTHI